MVKALSSDQGAPDFRWSASPEERNRLWQARHDAFYAAIALRQGAQGWTTDVCVPISRLAECILETQDDKRDGPLQVPLVGAVDDGTFHLVSVIVPKNQSDRGSRARD